jgi:ISXO2-like transposase domain
MERVTAKNLKPVLMESIAQDPIVNTDEGKVHRFARKHFAGHDVVKHAQKQYSRTEADGRVATTNTVEGLFSLLKRGVYGTFHHVGNSIFTVTVRSSTSVTMRETLTMASAHNKPSKMSSGKG